MPVESQTLVWTIAGVIVSSIVGSILVYLTKKLLHKEEKPKVAEPEISNPRECVIGTLTEYPAPNRGGRYHPTLKAVRFKFDAGNGKGTKDCSLSSTLVKLSFKKGDCIVKAEEHSLATSPHETIPIGQTKPITVYGFCESSMIQPNENTVEGIITAKFNNDQEKTLKSTFAITNDILFSIINKKMPHF
jgi:hypothetical protein